MMPKQRLYFSLDGGKPDRVPCICPGGMMNMITEELMHTTGIYLPQAHTDAKLMAKLSRAVYEQKCFENYGVPFCMTVEAEMMGAAVDLGTAVYEPHVTAYAIDSVCEYHKLLPIDVEKGRAKVTLDAIRLLRKEAEDVPVISNLTGPVSTASSVMESLTFYKELRKKNLQAHEYMEFITEQLIAFGRAQARAGADVITIADPSGTGEILGPRFFKEFTVTYINKILDALREEHVKTIVHICGQMSSVYKEVNEVRSHALSFDSIVPMGVTREHLPNRVLMGNVSTYTLEFGIPAQIRRHTRKCIRNGSDIISPACGLGMKSPLGNVQAMLNEVREGEEKGDNEWHP